MPMIAPHTHSRESGFTVVVVAALFIAMAVIAAAIVERNSTLQQITRRDAARDQLQKLSNAIIEYSVFNRNSSAFNLYPCPADITLATTSTSFGAAATNCYTGAASGFTILDTGTPSTSPIIGMVPVLELSAYGISINDAFDPWNSRILYVVNRTQTKNGTSPVQTTNPPLTDARTGATIAPPDFILISLGRDRLGATPRGTGSGAVSVGITCSASTVPRYENCDQDNTFLVAPTYTASSADTGGAYSGTSYFDDILTWYRQ